MAGSKKSVETAIGELTQYSRLIDGMLKSLDTSITALEAHEKLTGELEDLMIAILKDKKVSDPKALAKLEKQEETDLNEAIKKWLRNDVQTPLKGMRESARSVVVNLVSALKEVPKATK